jgi:RNA polymerase sigma-70 factor (ECF subfamily)
MSEARLLEVWRGGDEAAGRELLAACFEPLCRFFRAKLDADVDELIQHTMLLALQNFDRLREAESFRAYLFTIARHELFRHLRRRAALRDDVDFSVTSILDVRTSTSSAVARHRETTMLVEGLRRRPADEQIAVELFYWEECSYAEIAEVLGVHRDTVKRRLQRARASLREHLATLRAGRPVGDADLERWTKTAADDLSRPA